MNKKKSPKVAGYLIPIAMLFLILSFTLFSDNSVMKYTFLAASILLSAASLLRRK